MPILDKDQIAAFTAENPDWLWADDSIAKTYHFGEFGEAMAFVTRVALEAEKANHHPDIDIRWNEVTLRLSTHSEGGVTDKDLALGRILDDLS